MSTMMIRLYIYIIYIYNFILRVNLRSGDESQPPKQCSRVFFSSALSLARIFWNQILDFGTLRAGNWISLRGSRGKGRFWPNPSQELFGASFWPNPGQEPFGTRFWDFGGLRRPFGRLLNFAYRIKGKRPFLAKSWPETCWKQFLAIWRPFGRLLHFAFGMKGKRLNVQFWNE